MRRLKSLPDRVSVLVAALFFCAVGVDASRGSSAPWSFVRPFDQSSDAMLLAATSNRAVDAPARAVATSLSIINESVSPSRVMRGQTVAIKASFGLPRARTVATYFEIRNRHNKIIASQSYNKQVFSAGQVRRYTWNFTVPRSWAAAPYTVHAGIFTADWSKTLYFENNVSSFGVSSTPPRSSTPGSPTNPPGSATPSKPTPPPTPTNGRQFYVDSAAGSDSNGGTSPSAAWRSLNRVNRAAFRAGDIVNFKRGSSWSDELVVRSSGTQNSPVTYRAYGSGAAPHISNPGVSYGSAITVTGSYNVIRDFLLTDAHQAGLLLRGGASHNIVMKNEISRTGTGVTVSSQYNLITGNYVHDLRMIVNDPAPWTDYGAVCFWLQADNNEVSYNRGINCRAQSHDFKYDGGFVEVWQTGDNSFIHHNYAQNTNGFFELGANNNGSAQNIRVAYNTIVNVTAQGSGTSVCFNTGNYNINLGTFRFENNTFVSTEGHPDAYRVFGCRSDLSKLVLRNNIFYSDIQIANNGNFSHANNLYYMVSMVSGSGVGYRLGSREEVANPMFTNLSAGNFEPQAQSPAVDAGANLGYKRDFSGTAVPRGPAPDLGARECKH